MGGSALSTVVRHSFITNNAGAGGSGRAGISATRDIYCEQNVFYNNYLSNIMLNTAANGNTVIRNNLFEAGNVYNINGGSSGSTQGWGVDYNAFYGAGTANYNKCPGGFNDVIMTQTPFTNAPAGDFTLNSNGLTVAKAIGYPTSVPWSNNAVILDAQVPTLFNGPGSLGLLGNGTLSCVYSNGITNYGKNGPLLVKTSANSGVTWSATTTLIAAVASSDNVVRTTKTTTLNSGTLIMGIQSGTNTAIVAGTCSSYVLTSTDGTSYTQSSAITTPTGFGTAQPYSQIVEDGAGGDLYWAWNGVKSGGDTKNSIFVMKCPSGSNPLTGSNWVLVGGSATNAIIMRDAAQVKDYNEGELLRISSSIWLCVARVDTPTSGPMEYVRSTNNGQNGGTWSAAAVLTDTGAVTTKVGVSPAMTLLANGNILLNYGERGTANSFATNFIGNGVTISTDNGVTWVPLQMLISEIANTDIAYSSSIQLANASLVMVFYNCWNAALGAGSLAWLWATNYTATVGGGNATYAFVPATATNLDPIDLGALQHVESGGGSGAPSFGPSGQLFKGKV